LRTILAALTVLVGATNAVGQSINPEGTAEFTANKGSHTARLIFTTRRFNPSAHRIVRANNCITIDGRIPIGTDCTIPKVEIVSMKLILNGKAIPIPKHLNSDCYGPPPFSEYQKRGLMKNYLAIRFSDDLAGVFVFLAGGDGAGVYDAMWILRRDGRHSRFTNSGGDCHFFDLGCRPSPN